MYSKTKHSKKVTNIVFRNLKETSKVRMKYFKVKMTVLLCLVLLTGAWVLDALKYLCSSQTNKQRDDFIFRG